MKEQILNLLAEVLPQIDFTSSDNLMDDGILDSMSIMTMVSELSLEYGIQFDMDELVPENMNSIDAIVALVEKLQSEQ